MPENEINRQQPALPNPEVLPRAKRRTFTAEYKLRILQEADQCTQLGEIGALLRREGLYSSHLSKWRRLREAGQLQALSAQRRGPKAKRDARAAEMEGLRRENERLRQQLQQAELIIDAQKNLPPPCRSLWTTRRRTGHSAYRDRGAGHGGTGAHGLPESGLSTQPLVS